MTQAITIERTLQFSRRRRGRKSVAEIAATTTVEPASVRVPRIARLMALAIRFDHFLENGVVNSFSELARLGSVTRARVTQIMNLRMLAPDIQEEILFMPGASSGRDPIHLGLLQSVALELDWHAQRLRWKALLAAHGVASADAKQA